MKKKLLLLISFFLILLLQGFGLNGQSLLGEWEVEKIKIITEVDNSIHEETFKIGDSFQTVRPCIEKVAFNNSEIKITYKGETNAEQGTYSLSGDTITGVFTTTVFRYNYTLTDENSLVLIIQDNYISETGEIASEKDIYYARRR